MILMLDIDSQIFELPDEKFDLVLLRVSAHVAQLFVFVPGDDLVDCPGEAVGNGHLGLIRGA